MRYSYLTVGCALLISACQPAEQTIDQDPYYQDTGVQENNLLHVARSAKAAGNLESAAALYQQIANQSHSSVTAYLELASLQQQMDKPQLAVRTLTQAQKMQPDNIRVLDMLGKALLASGQAAQAVPVFVKMTSLDSTYVSAYTGRGVAYDKLGKHTLAQEAYQQGLAIAPENLALSNNLGLSYILNAQYDQAIALLEPLKDREDAPMKVRQNLAMAYGLKGNNLRAMEIALKDLTPEQAMENIKFYEHVRSKQRLGTISDEEVNVITAVDVPQSIDTQTDALLAQIEEEKEVEPVAVIKPVEAEIANAEEKTIPQTTASTQAATPIPEMDAETKALLAEIEAEEEKALASVEKESSDMKTAAEIDTISAKETATAMEQTEQPAEPAQVSTVAATETNTHTEAEIDAETKALLAEIETEEKAALAKLDTHESISDSETTQSEATPAAEIKTIANDAEMQALLEEIKSEMGEESASTVHAESSASEKEVPVEEILVKEEVPVWERGVSDAEIEALMEEDKAALSPAAGDNQENE